MPNLTNMMGPLLGVKNTHLVEKWSSVGYAWIPMLGPPLRSMVMTFCQINGGQPTGGATQNWA